MKITGIAIKPGTVLQHDGGLWVAVKTTVVKPGKGGAFAQVELKNLIDGRKLNERFRTSDTVDAVTLDRKDFQYLYEQGSALVFMDQVTYEQIELQRDFVGEDQIRFLHDGMIDGTDKTHTWIVDPLDGTTNFLHAMPHFAINIALQREGGIVAAVTYNPATSDLFWAERGRGAYLNDRRLRVAARARFEEAVFATGIPFMGHGQHARFLKELHQISQRVSGVRRFGAAALDLAWVAAGRFDGYWERDLHPWDIAAGILLVTEAGGKVTDADGGEDPLATGSICAANPELHGPLLDRLKAAG